MFIVSPTELIRICFCAPRVLSAARVRENWFLGYLGPVGDGGERARAPRVLNWRSRGELTVSVREANLGACEFIAETWCSESCGNV